MTNSRPAPVMALLALLCVLAYLPSLFLPLVEDDYPMINEARTYGPPAEFHKLMDAPVFRSRATSYWTIDALWDVFHLRPMAYHAASLALHIVNTWLVYCLALLWPRMRPAAFWAAAFFAVQEGHQEAVMWFAAITELLQFLFGMGALVCWMLAGTRRRAWPWYVAAFVLWVLAMFSKESAVIFAPLLLMITPPRCWRRTIPFLAVTLFVVAGIFAQHGSSYRFSDGSFSLHAPFWITWPRGIARLLWFWGWLAGTAILLAKNREAMKSALWALAWIGIALVPYSFLTYSMQIPSRQTYLASVGLVLLFGVAMATVATSRRIAAAVMLLLIVHNVGYLWTKKRRQFLDRAAPTQQLLRLARGTPGPLWVRCFPRNRYIAEQAIHVALGRNPADLVWTEEEAARRNATPLSFCP